MKKILVLGIMALVFLLAGSNLAAEPIKLGMSTWLGYAPLYLAKEKGFFQKVGLYVEIVFIESPGLYGDRMASYLVPEESPSKKSHRK
jgi:NitT/TauT family transport system substrate-binding protein